MTDSSPAVVGRPLPSSNLLNGENDKPRSIGLMPHVGIRLSGFGRLTELPDASPSRSTPRSWYECIKRSLELCVSGTLLVVTAPLVLLGAVLVKLTSRGPAFYSQMRVGRYGRPFPIIKLRTMTHNCEAASGAVWATASDPRITPLGKFLRRSHIDELPQLWNVLRGQMSLIGPRPERPEFLPVLEQAIAGYRGRLQVRPGVTGLAQVQLPADTDLASVQRKLAYDLYYIERMGPGLDCRVLLATLTKVMGAPFPVTRALFALPRWEEVHTPSAVRLQN